MVSKFQNKADKNKGRKRNKPKQGILISNPVKMPMAGPSLRGEEYAQIFHSMPAPACITFVKDGRFVEVNNAFCRETGYSRFELAGRTAVELGFYEQPEYRMELLQMVQSIGVYSSEVSFRLKSGQLVPFLASITLFERAGNPCLLTILQNLSEQTNLKKELQETALKFRTLFENSRDAIGVSIAGMHAYVNPAYLELFGYSSFEELKGRPLFDLIAPDNREQMREIVRKRSQELDAPTLYETRGLRKDGSEFDMEVRSSTYELDSDLYTLGLIRDVTERKKMMDQLLASEEKYRSIVENAQEGIISYNSTWYITFANARGEAIFGYKRGEMLGRHIIDIILDEDRPTHAERRKRWENGLQGTYEGCYKKKDGTLVWLQVSGWTVTDNDKFGGVVTLITDITERKLAEKALLENETRFRRALEAAGAVPYSHDLITNTYTFMGDGVLELTGYTAQEITPALFFSLQSEEHFTGEATNLTVKEAVERFRAGKLTKWRSDSYVTRKDGNKLWIVDTSVPIFDLEGKITSSMGFLQDFTERKQAEDNLHRLNQELAIAYEETIEGWSQAMDLRDKETEGHTQRVTEMSVQLAQAFGLSSEDIVQIRRGALLHDIGKIGVPDNVLLKAGSLTEDEWVIMRKHPEFAYNMLSSIRYLRPALNIPYCHHEKWDGTGYPRGLKGDEIPLEARIFAVVDVWDALTSDRPYRTAWTSEKTLEYILAHAGSHFDPMVVEKFIEYMSSQPLRQK